MKLFLNLICVGFFLFAGQIVFSGVGGIGGGSSKVSVEYVIVKVCNGGESGSQCQEVRLNSEKFDENGNLKNPSQVDASVCTVLTGEGYEVPCKPEIEYKVPKILQKLNTIFSGWGQTATPFDPAGF
jgi:hypothetical protein